MKVVHKRVSGERIAIDGKVLRSSYNREDRQSTIHMVSAFASANGVVLGQVKTDAKSNEITVITSYSIHYTKLYEKTSLPELSDLLSIAFLAVLCQVRSHLASSQ